MADTLFRSATTFDSGLIPADSQLTITEVPGIGLWSVQPDHYSGLVMLTQKVFGTDPNPGGLLQDEENCLIQLWPNKAFLRRENAALPESTLTLMDLLTDISHGFCELKLSDIQAFDFVSVYCSADVTQPTTRTARTIRCLLGHYPIVIWWNNTSDIRILVDRSYAQSLRDYLAHLMSRWSWD
ncbi:MAG: hypothetical protein GKR95_16570 [Gammaproteobacteria bacterium]|nr:hypothetical protein [Gammaproteobacteria bacterium]